MKRGLLIYVNLFFSFYFSAQTRMTDTSSVFPLYKNAAVIEQGGNLTADQLFKNTRLWEKATNRYAWDFTSKTFWLKLPFSCNYSGAYQLFLDYNGLNEVEFFLYSDSLISTARSGNQIPWSSRPAANDKACFGFNAQAGINYTALIKVRAGYGMSFFPLYGGSENACLRSQHTESRWINIFYGVSLIMSITFFISWLFTRDRNYLLYSAVTALHFLNRFSFNGDIDSWLGDHPLLRHTLDSITQSVSMAVVILFILFFLNTSSGKKWIHYGLIVTLILLLASVPAALFIHPNAGILAGNNLGVPIMILSIAAAWRKYRKEHYKPAGYFMWGWGFFYAGVIFLLLTYTGLLPPVFLHSFLAGIVFEMIFFSVAVAENYQLITRKEKDAQASLIRQLKENERIKDEANRQLESKVEERTRELKEQKELAEEQKKIVEEKQQAILDSIRYAKRIQTALMPPEKTIHRAMQRLRSGGK